MQDMPALSDDGTATHLTANQQTYIRKKINHLAQRLQDHVHDINPSLSVGYRINLTPMSFEMDISLATPRLTRQYLAHINGFIDLKWAHQNGHGKDLQVCGNVAVGEGRGQNRTFDSSPLNLRLDISTLAKQIIAGLTDMDALPAVKNKRAREAWVTLKTVNFQPWKAKKHLKRHFEEQNRLHIDTPSDDMTRAIERATRRWADNFRRRYAVRNDIFENVDFTYNPLRFTMEASFNIADHHATENRKITVKGPVSVGWKGGHHCFYFTPEAGITLPYEASRIEIGGDNTSAQLLNVIMDSGVIKSPEALFAPGALSTKKQRKAKNKRSFDLAANDNAADEPRKKDEAFERKRDRNRYARRMGKHALKKTIASN